jgi:hypothetical protein
MMILRRGLLLCCTLSLRPINHLGTWRVVSVHDQEALLAAAEHAIDTNLAVLNSKNGTGSRVCRLILGACPIAEDNNDFILVLRSDERF